MHTHKIEKKLSYICLFLLALGICSCRSSKELVYINDVNGQAIAGLPKAMPLYRIKKKDNLFISIITSNADLNKIYNPTQAGNNSETNRFENQAGQFINGYEVNNEGNVDLPVIGNVKVEGRSIADAQKEVETQATAYLKGATVKVKLLNFRVTVLGEVKLPGVYYNYNNSFTVLDALGIANGNTDYADISNILVLRPTADGSQTYKLNLNTKAALSSDGFYLQPNDVVFVQPGRNKFYQTHVSTAAVILTSISSILLLLNYIHK
jgi:polysaccharide export outer membrane protein